MFAVWSLYFLFCTYLYDVVAEVVESASSNLDSRVDGYKSHSDIRTKWQFLNRVSLPIEQAPFTKAAQSPSQNFFQVPIASATSVLLSLRNVGESSFNITSITGYFHAAHRFSFYVQNHTRRAIHSVLAPNSELTLEYWFHPWPGLAPIDYVFSADVEYGLLLNAESDSKRLPMQYKEQFVNVTVSVYDSNPMKWLDFQLLLMVVLIAIFWAFMGVLFYEFWWIPNQTAQGIQAIPTDEFIMFVYQNYLLYAYYLAREMIWQEPHPMKGLGGKGAGNMSGTDLLSGQNGFAKQDKNSWLSGTSAGTKKKNKKKKN